MPDAPDPSDASPSMRPFILILAGVNGAGKSSVGGALLAEHGLTWFNPDSFARELRITLGLSVAEANGRAWQHGRDLLQAAISGADNHACETTLGGQTITELLIEAAGSHDLVMLFCGLSSVEQHLQRVRLRVASGGHDIPEAKIRQRWVTSRANLLKLLPRLTHLQVFDNSATVARGDEIPDPLLVLETSAGRVIYPSPDDLEALARTPDWARAIVQAAFELRGEAEANAATD